MSQADGKIFLQFAQPAVVGSVLLVSEIVRLFSRLSRLALFRGFRSPQHGLLNLLQRVLNVHLLSHAEDDGIGLVAPVLVGRGGYGILREDLIDAGCELEDAVCGGLVEHGGFLVGGRGGRERSGSPPSDALYQVRGFVSTPVCESFLQSRVEGAGLLEQHVHMRVEPLRVVREDRAGGLQGLHGAAQVAVGVGVGVLRGFKAGAHLVDVLVRVLDGGHGGFLVVSGGEGVEGRGTVPLPVPVLVSHRC